MFGSAKRRVALLAWLVALVHVAQGVCALGNSRSATAPLQSAGLPLVINEFMAANGGPFLDPQNEADDWVEIHNTGDQTVDMAGMYLTDNVTLPTQWKVPANLPHFTQIPAKGYAVVWLDNEMKDPGLHGAFELDAMGDAIALFAADGTTLIDSVTFGRQVGNVSYGRFPNGSSTWGFLSFPTPGTPNAAAYEGVVADTKFSRDRGFYDAPFDVTITCKTPGATIYYTTDGSEPASPLGRFSLGTVYNDPIRITKTTCLRARAIRDGWMSSNVDTHTYIFLDDVCRQATNPATGAQVTPSGYPSTWPGGSYSGTTTGDYQMDPDVVDQNGKDKFGGLYAKTIKDDLKAAPTVSLVMEKDNWFGPTGIYINESQDGTERVCSLEWIDPNGAGGFQVNCALAMQGGVSGGGTSLDRWKVFKLSMRPRFKTGTDDGKPTGGPARLDYRVFPDSPVERFDTFVLDEVLSNAWNHRDQHMYPTYLQDQSVSDLHNAMGGQSPHGLYAHLYLNGLYWGMYYVHERPDHAWAAQMFGGEKEQYDVLKHYTSMVVNDGIGGSAVANFNAMLSAANAVAADPTNAAKYQALCRMLDVDNFITDLLAHWFAVNWDWPEKNWYATHRSPDGLWRFHTWDAEHSLEYWNSQNVLGLSVAGIHDKLKANADYRMRFADHVHRHFFNGGALSYPNTANRYRARMAQIDRAIVGESARWGDTRSAAPHTREDWVVIQNNIFSRFLQPRSTFVLDWLKGAGLYPGVDAPTFRINSVYQHGGHAPIGAALSMQAGSTIWYTLDGSDPRVPGTTAAADDEIKLVAESAAKRVLIPTGPINNAWRGGQAFDDSAWVSGTGGVGFERSSGYESFFKIDVQSQMYGRNATCCVRVPFTVSASDVGNLSSLTLKVRYDDGFVAYLNGSEIARKNFTGEPAWNSAAGAQNPDAAAVDFEAFSVAGHVDKLHQGQNILAIHSMNVSTTNSDFLISVELVSSKASAGGVQTGVSPTAVKYASPITLQQSAQVKARARSGGTWSALNEAVFAVGPVAQSLRVSEIMYHPLDSDNPDDPNTEYIELTNIASQAINLNLVHFTKGIDYSFPSLELPPAGYCLIVKDIAAFEAKYGFKLPVVGEYQGNLNNAGERLELVDAAGQVIQSLEYQDNWYDITDGRGFSLTVKDPQGADANSFSSKSFWRPSAQAGGSPGTDDSGQVPELGSVVINELLANSQGVGPDWIELYNTTNQTLSVGGWFLSDDANNLTKYRIAAGTSIPAGGYLVFYENKHFGNKADPGCQEPFALSKDGETLYLHSGSGGVLSGYCEQEKFDASEAGVSLGRWQKSTGSYNFVALITPTPGKANAAPAVGPVVINEIMYHPQEAQDDEYVELLNISSSPVTLYDGAQKAPWRFTDGGAIELLLPAEAPVTLAPGEYLVLAKDAGLLRSKYSVPETVQVLAWGAGNLADSGEKIQLSKPGDAQDDGTRHWIRVDRVAYSDGLYPQDFPEGVDPWPVKANGQGLSLSRIDPHAYGNDPENWKAATPSPGLANN
jgi:hypothetical protein